MPRVTRTAARGDEDSWVGMAGRGAELARVAALLNEALRVPQIEVIALSDALRALGSIFRSPPAR